jgi:hypothetical protein
LVTGLPVFPPNRVIKKIGWTADVLVQADQQYAYVSRLQIEGATDLGYSTRGMRE